MPNWCDNSLYIEAPADEIAAIKAAILKGEQTEQGLLNYFCPEPQHEIAEDEMIPAWYSWRTNNWGTKWEVDAQITGETETSLYIHFQSAWSPPIEALQCWLDRSEQHIVDLRYMEWGMMFCGIFSNEEDAHYSIPATVAEVQDMIPAELDEQFGISDMIEQWKQYKLEAS